ncbi:uncharacterized protein AAEQ78_016909 isoform 4-T4 [Lycaon pictus]
MEAAAGQGGSPAVWSRDRGTRHPALGVTVRAWGQRMDEPGRRGRRMSSKKADPKAASEKWLTSLPGAKPGAAAGESDPRSSTDLGRPLCSCQGCAQETLPSESGFQEISELGSGTVDGGFGAQKSIPDPGPETRAPALGWGEGHGTRTHGDGTQARGDSGQVLRQSSGSQDRPASHPGRRASRPRGPPSAQRPPQGPAARPPAAARLGLGLSFQGLAGLCRWQHEQPCRGDTWSASHG